ncbi:MAG: alpha-amylase family glycosyl hydrolase [bacterium]
MKSFHPTRAARERYAIERTLFASNGDLVLTNGAAVRRLAARMNAMRAPGLATVQAGELAALGLIHEIFHLVVERYQADVRPGALVAALAQVDARLGSDAERLLLAFGTEFPGLGPGLEPRVDRLEELVLNRVANENPALGPLRELVDDRPLAASTRYREAISALEAYFSGQPPFGPEGETLLELLRVPARHAPSSLADQLRYIRDHWGPILGEALARLMRRLGMALDVLAEEERGLWMRFHGGAGDGRRSGEGPGLAGLDAELERFSMDRDWMPRIVLMAKSTHVWLDHLSRRYRRRIRTLDAIPDEELDTLARWGITGLWLIGLWERSRASQRIKQMRGNPEAAASAYSLLDYRIADDLGGDAAYASLRDRAWSRRIRLASDMVPNHMGIDSTWVIEHPDRFLSLPESPFPSYSFTGADLSSDERVAIVLEDHYWNSSDAAVVFKRVDRRSGETRYVYHGNDGTSFPWNDTAQLDYLKPDVREAVIQTILHVARRFPVIRFDAAMTLAKRHIQRLWFPQPGSAGAIPSRAEHGMTKAEFDAAMPVEFWREVVDRVAAEAPDTLLLAEAFWMLEGYFVRTLGMHRVYNSAFMHMLRDEDNAGYRRVMKDTLEFDPEILKRYVNFMSNPDERMAVEQFGKGDKYFGVCTLMVTLPGLPMFGHGQVEGFAEKYGMEYQRAYKDETIDAELVRRHEREIFPLLHGRYLFAEVRDFLLYDVFARDGSVIEDVFAFSNRAGSERSLIVYHNRYASASGWIRSSVAYAEKAGADGEKVLRQRTLGEGLGLSDAPDRWLIFRDAISGLEYLRESRALLREGLYVELGAYQRQVFLGFREVVDGPTRQYGRLAERLAGAGAPAIEESLRALQLEPVHAPLRRLLEAEVLAWIEGGDGLHLDEIRGRYDAFLAAVAEAAGDTADGGLRVALARDVRDLLEAVVRLDALVAQVRRTGSAGAAAAARAIDGHVSSATRAKATLTAWSLLRGIGRPADPSADAAAAARTSRARFDELRLGPVLAGSLHDLGVDDAAAWQASELVRVLIALPRSASVGGGRRERGRRVIAAWLADESVRSFLRVNEWQGVLWFNQEAFQQLTVWMLILDAVESASPERPTARVAASWAASLALAAELRVAAEASGFRVDRLAAWRPTPPHAVRPTAKS